MMRGLKGKRFVVAGGAAGIGKAIAIRLCEEGAKVVVGDIDTATLDATIAEMTKDGGTAAGVRFDFTDPASTDALIAACVDTYGGIDGLANVGWDFSKHYLSGDVDILEVDEDVWKRAFDCGVMGYNRTMRAALPHFVKQRSGSIVNVSSGAAHIGEPTRGAYASSKLALHAVTRHVARRWGAENIRCNVLAPGKVPTGKAKESKKEGQDDMKRLLAIIPLGRAGTPAELGASAAFLLSDDASWVTGQVWSVNGGQTMRD